MATVNDSLEVANLAKEVTTLCKRANDVYIDETLRATLLQATKKLSIALEKPADAVFQTAFLVTCPLLLTSAIQVPRMDY